MGCCCSKTPVKLPRHADDRELDEWDIEEVGIEKVDTTFRETYAPVQSLIELNNNMVAGTDRVKIAVAALLGAYTLHLVAEEKEGTKVISVAIKDKDKKNLDDAAIQKLCTDNVEFGKNFVILKKMISTANAKLVQAMKKKGKMPETIVPLKDFKLQCQTGEGKRFVDAELNAAMDNMNIQAFHVAHDLIKVSLTDGLDLAKAIKNAFEKMKEELKDKLQANLKANMDRIMEGEVELEFTLGDFEPTKLLPEALATVYSSLMELIELVKGSAVTISELKPKVETVPDTIQGFDAQAAVKEAASGNPLQLPGMLKKVVANSAYAADAPKVLKHTPDTALAIVGDLQAAFTETFKH